ncbi:MAG: N-acetylmuramoyl-L-alanine amidase [Bacteroidetes bacterium]|nr:N-acetylmuramoyl-L-alanine amidase [Bacteroidota bacterium]
MIASIFIYSLKSTICSAIFVAYYLLVLKNTQMNSFNRVYLLMAALCSLLLPFTDFQLLHIAPTAVPDFPLLQIAGQGTETDVVKHATTTSFNWWVLLEALYYIVAIAMVLMLVVKSVFIIILKKKGQPLKREGFVLVKTNDSRAPFSFMNMLFWPVHMREDSPEGNGVLMHELAHIRQHHTIDKVCMQLMLAVCWLNPFNWFIKKELWLQHEFLADRYAIKDGDGDMFARMLLLDVADAYNKSIISPFFQSPVKRRFLMLTASAKNKYALLRRFLSVPVMLIAVFLLSAYTDKSAPVAASQDKIVLVLDPAHGGEDAGGKSAYGYQEKDFTLALCKKMEALAGAYNIKIIATRNEDTYPSLEERVKLGNSTNDAIFLSVHINQSSAVRDNTYQLGINPKGGNYSKSALLASAIGAKLKSQQLPVEVVDHRMAYILRESKHPAILIECGNLDDPENIALLKDNARTDELCRNILSGIVDYNTRLKAQK